MRNRNAALCLAVISLLGSLAVSRSQEATGGKQPTPLTKIYFGVSVCKECHQGQTAPAEDAWTYRGDEMGTWVKHDKHKLAAVVLTQELGQQIGKRLGWDVVKDTRCTKCHGVHVEDERLADPRSYSPDKRTESGVSCVACHGHYAEWVDEHAKRLRSKWQDYTARKRNRASA